MNNIEQNLPSTTAGAGRSAGNGNSAAERLSELFYEAIEADNRSR